MALYRVCKGGEQYKNWEDKIIPGEDIGFAFAGCFLMFRGTPMKQEWINDYVVKKGDLVRLPGNSSYSRNLTVALKFAFKDQAQDKKPVLFLLLHRNYNGIGSVMMNGEAYSSYPSEGEMLLMEGLGVIFHGYEE